MPVPVTGEWPLPALILAHELTIFFSLPCPAREVSDRVALVVTWHRAGVSPPHLWIIQPYPVSSVAEYCLCVIVRLEPTVHPSFPHCNYTETTLQHHRLWISLRQSSHYSNKSQNTQVFFAINILPAVLKKDQFQSLIKRTKFTIFFFTTSTLEKSFTNAWKISFEPSYVYGRAAFGLKQPYTITEVKSKWSQHSLPCQQWKSEDLIC